MQGHQIMLEMKNVDGGKTSFYEVHPELKSFFPPSAMELREWLATSTRYLTNQYSLSIICSTNNKGKYDGKFIVSLSPSSDALSHVTFLVEGKFYNGKVTGEYSLKYKNEMSNEFIYYWYFFVNGHPSGHFIGLKNKNLTLGAYALGRPCSCWSVYKVPEYLEVNEHLLHSMLEDTISLPLTENIFWYYASLNGVHTLLAITFVSTTDITNPYVTSNVGTLLNYWIYLAESEDPNETHLTIYEKAVTDTSSGERYTLESTLYDANYATLASVTYSDVEPRKRFSTFVPNKEAFEEKRLCLTTMHCRPYVNRQLIRLPTKEYIIFCLQDNKLTEVMKQVEDQVEVVYHA